MLFETHSHTPLCNHAVGEPTDYAAIAEQRGLHGIIVTCHNPMPNGFSARVRMREDQFDEYVDLVAKTRDEWEGRIDVRLGLEADFFEGYESYLERQLSSADFHYVLGSVHPQLEEFFQKYWQNDLAEVQKSYFHLLAVAAETGLFDSLAHPDLIKNHTSEAWNIDLIMDDVCRALDRIAVTGVAMELNTSGVNKTISEMNPCPQILEQMNLRGIPVVIGADAHQPERVGDGFQKALRILNGCGYSQVSYFLDRKRKDISIETAVRDLADQSVSI